MTVQNKKTDLELTRKHLEKIAKSKSTKYRDCLQGVKYSGGNKATVTDSHRALVIKYENETFEDSLINLRTLIHMDISNYPDVERVIPQDKDVPNTLTLEQHTIKKMLTDLRRMKKMKNIAIKLEEDEEDSNLTKCYLESRRTYADEPIINIKLYLGSIPKVKSDEIVLQNEYLLNVVQFAKDTKESAVLKFGAKFMPVVFENTLTDRLSYQYILCPVRVY